MKAKFLYKTKDEKGYDLLWYEYRGRDYCVQYNTEESFTYQHKKEQERIDLAIETLNKPLTTEDAMIGFKLFWDYIEGE